MASAEFKKVSPRKGSPGFSVMRAAGWPFRSKTTFDAIKAGIVKFFDSSDMANSGASIARARD